MIVKIIFAVASATIVLGAAGFARPAHAASGVLHDQESILREFFPAAERVEARTVAITPALGAALKTDLGYAMPKSSYTVFVGVKGGRELGYAVIDDQKGMHEPITFAVLVGPDGAVQRQEVMVYRESEGDGVTAGRFERQFIGKTVKDPIRAGDDIMIVSSATISSNSMAVGVKRAVALVTEAILTRSPHPLAAPAGALPVPASGR